MCIFCSIASGEIPTEKLYEDNEVVAFRDIHPITPVHILVIPKRHIASMNDATPQDISTLGKMLFVAKELASKEPVEKNGETKTLAERGYKLLLRTGHDGGQEVPHIHLHLLGGGKMREGIEIIR